MDFSRVETVRDSRRQASAAGKNGKLGGSRRVVLEARRWWCGGLVVQGAMPVLVRRRNVERRRDHRRAML
jgi:hypothetical protein